MVGTYHGNKIDKLGKMIGPISHQSITNMAGIGQMSLHRKKSSLEQSSSLHNQIHHIINPKYLKKERDKNLKFAQEWLLQMKQDT